MPLGGEIFETLYKALVDAYRHYGELQRMTRFRLNESLGRFVSSDKGMDTVIYELIEWFDAEGRVIELVEATKADKEQNLLVAALDPARFRTASTLIAAEAASPTADFKMELKATLNDLGNATSDGLYLSRLINPPVRGAHDVVTTVWVAARGNQQYFLNSARVLDYAPDGAGPLAAAALVPDAEYRFTYRDGSDRTETLNPPLSVGPESRRVAWFTVAVAPDWPLYSFGDLWIIVNYDTLDAGRGTLVLSEPLRLGREIAVLVGDDVLVGELVGSEFIEQVVTPQALQRGLDEGRRPALQFIPIEFPQQGWPNHDEYVSFRQRTASSMARREELNRSLKAAGKISQLTRMLGELAGAPVGPRWNTRYRDLSVDIADLLGGIGDDAATHSLASRLERNPGDDAAFHGWCVRHLAVGDEQLATHVLKHQETFADSQQLSNAATVLTMKPTGKWLEVLALVQSSRRFVGLHDVVATVKDELRTVDLHRLMTLAGGLFGPEVFIRGTMNAWGTPPEAKLERIDVEGYSVTLTLAASVQRFKVADARWSNTCNWGAAREQERLQFGAPFPMTCHNLSPDIVLDISSGTDGRYRFDIDASDPTTPSITVSMVNGG